jgi:hypothetical protein
MPWETACPSNGALPARHDLVSVREVVAPHDA